MKRRLALMLVLALAWNTIGFCATSEEEPVTEQELLLEAEQEGSPADPVQEPELTVVQSLTVTACMDGGFLKAEASDPSAAIYWQTLPDPSLTGSDREAAWQDIGTGTELRIAPDGTVVYRALAVSEEEIAISNELTPAAPAAAAPAPEPPTEEELPQLSEAPEQSEEEKAPNLAAEGSPDSAEAPAPQLPTEDSAADPEASETEEGPGEETEEELIPEEEPAEDEQLEARAASGTCGTNLTYTLENGTLTITGTGAMSDWSDTPYAPWYSDRSSVTSVVIEDGVTSIGENAFSGCSRLKSVTIPSSVTSIGDGAFYTSSLKSVYYTGSLAQWLGISFSSYFSNPCGNGATLYINGSALTSVEIPEGTTTIGSYAFSGCSSLKSVTIPSSVTSIGSDAFKYCSSLKSVYYTGSLAQWLGISFSDWACNPCCNGATLYINGSALTSVEIPEGTTTIGSYAFRGCSSLTSVTIPSSVTSIGSSAFNNCSSLTSVTIPSSVTSIGSSAFYGCSSLTSVTIPSSVTSIGYEAFSGCRSDLTITTDGSQAAIRYAKVNGIKLVTSAPSIGLNKYISYMPLGCRQTLKATVANILNKTVIWTSSDPTVATVSGGVVVAKAEGLATITATLKADPSVYAECEVCVCPAPTDIYFDSGFFLYAGDALSFETLSLIHLIGDGSNSDLTWSSGNPKVASVDTCGVVTGLTAGTTTITATTMNGRKATTQVEVVDPTKRRLVCEYPGTIPLNVGDGWESFVILFPEETYDFNATYTSSNTKVATVDEYGTVTPVGEGTATITITATDYGLTTSYKVKVTDPTKPTGIVLSETGTVEARVMPDNEGVLHGVYNFTYTLLPEGAAQSPVTIKSSAPAIAKPDPETPGRIELLGEGIATITVTATKTNKSASFKLKVTDPTKPSGIVLDRKGTVAMDIHDKLEVQYTLLPEETAVAGVTFKSSNAKVATVDANGVVTPVSEGTATITATTTRNNKTASFTVKITDPTKPTGVRIDMAATESIEIPDGLWVYYTLLPEGIAESPVTFKSSNAKVATVDEDGYITPLTEGTVTITVTATKNNKSASFRLKVTDPTKPTAILLDQVGTVDMDIHDVLMVGYALLPSGIAQSTVTFKSSNTKVAMVDEKGYVIPMSEGTATITATATKTNKSASFKVKITDPYKPTGVRIDMAATELLEMPYGMYVGYTLLPEGLAESPVTFKSSNARVATVDKDGYLIPMGEGTATITVTTTKNNKSASFKVKVTDPIKATAVYAESGIVEIGDNFSIDYRLVPENSTSSVSFTSSNARVVRVESDGTLTALATGTAIITVRTSTGKTARVTIKVE